MIFFSKILRWAIIAYVTVWIGGFFVGAYHLAVPLRFMIPTVSAAVFLIVALSPKGRTLDHWKVWVVFGIGATAINAFLSWDSWRLYLIQNDAPMGLIPDLNAVLCLVVDFLLLALVFGGVSLYARIMKMRKKSGTREDATSGRK